MLDALYATLTPTAYATTVYPRLTATVPGGVIDGGMGKIPGGS